MEYLNGTKEFQFHNTVVSLGKFDGVHIGHRKLIDAMMSFKKKGLRTVVFSFSMNPGSFFSKNGETVIYSGEEKKLCLEELGVDALIVYPFTKETAEMEAADFVGSILTRQLNAKVIVAGKDFRFGHNRTGDVALLSELSEQYGYETRIFDKVKLDRRPVSSSAIREVLLDGRLEEANRMLGQPYFIYGEVIHGNELGRTLGMPTANLIPAADKLLPPRGVYLSRVSFNHENHQGITNIGYKPTVGGELGIGAETYLYDYSGNLYGKNIKVELYKFIRGERKFDSLEDLKSQMHRDMERGRL